MATTELSQELRTSFRQVTVTATIQCAGNRRAEVAAVKLVEGRAPWNAGGWGSQAIRTTVELAECLVDGGPGGMSLQSLGRYKFNQTRLSVVLSSC